MIMTFDLLTSKYNHKVTVSLA